jgi:F-type H+-transporting ATPase subunit c
MRKQLLMVMLVLAVLAVAAPVMAEGTAVTEQGNAQIGATALKNMWQFIAAAFVLGVAAFGGALGQSKAIVAACTSMGRNPGAAGPVRITMIVGVAFIESLVIYALLLAFVILGK